MRREFGHARLPLYHCYYSLVLGVNRHQNKRVFSPFSRFFANVVHCTVAYSAQRACDIAIDWFDAELLFLDGKVMLLLSGEIH